MKEYYTSPREAGERVGEIMVNGFVKRDQQRQFDRVVVMGAIAFFAGDYDRSRQCVEAAMQVAR